MSVNPIRPSEASLFDGAPGDRRTDAGAPVQTTRQGRPETRSDAVDLSPVARLLGGAAAQGDVQLHLSPRELREMIQPKEPEHGD